MHSSLRRLEDEQLFSHGFELFDLDLDLGQSSFDEHFGVPAGAATAVAHIEQLFDVTEAQAHPLQSLDESQPLGATPRRRAGSPRATPAGSKRPTRS